MTLKNERLIAIVKALGEDVVLDKMEAKLKHDAQQKTYHKRYNAQRNATFKNLRQLAEEAGLSVEAYIARVAQGKGL